MLQSFAVTNFRSFDDRAQIYVAPLTLLFGPNNSGKSGLLRLLPFLADSFDPRAGAPLNLESACIRGAGFVDLVCRATESQTVTVELEWDDAARLEVQFREFDGAARAAQVHLQHGSEAFEGTWSLEGDLYDTADGRVEVRFQGPAPRGEPFLPPVVAEIADRAGRLPAHVLWLEATREPVSREGAAPRGTPIRLGQRGEKAVAVCATDEEVRRSVSQWYERHFDSEFLIQRTAYHVRPELRRVTSPYSVPLPDCGEGFSQALPVVTAVSLAALDRGPRILCIEHPELHLHPDAHPAVADLFLDLASSTPTVRTLLESHSESLLLAVLLAIAEERLREEDVAIYWVRQRQDGTSAVERAGPEPGARLGPSFPPGTFKKDTELARQLVRKRRSTA